jgi:hypothetical protein
MNHRLQAPTGSTHSRPRARRSILAVAALAVAVLLASVPAGSGREAEAGRLYSALDRMAKLTSRQVRPPAARVADGLPGTADGLGRLREPASTAETQVGIALGELQQMSALTYDPHYAPALVAAGRAFVAITGQDPLTRTAVNPEYLGLDRELAGNASSLQTAGREAARVLRGVKRLNRELIRSKRHAGRLERQLRQIRARGAGEGSSAR